MIYKAPLRWLGGKSKIIDTLSIQFPNSYDYYLEPFLGGGSSFLLVRSQFSKMPCWINDINPLLIKFWRQVQLNSCELYKALWKILVARNTEEKMRKLFDEKKRLLLNPDSNSDFEIAIAYYIHILFAYSGREGAGFSHACYKKHRLGRLDRIIQTGELLDGVRITNLDYSDLLKNIPTPDSFIFLDPPYSFENCNRRGCYGINGKYHNAFDHQKFFNDIQKIDAKYFVTFDYNIDVIKKFSQPQYRILPFTTHYSCCSSKAGHQMSIMNYSNKIA